MSFRSFLEQLSDQGQITEIGREVDPKLEAASIAGEIDGPVLFENVAGFKAAVNLLCEKEIISQILGVEPEQLIEYLSEVRFKGEMRIVDDSPVKENSMEPDLSKLPVFTYFEKDGGPYITSGIVVSQREGMINAAFHRMMLIGKNKLAVRLVAPRDTYTMHQEAASQGEHLPVGIAIGVDPVIMLAAATRMPENMEFIYAAALRKDAVELFELENGVNVPHAEIVLEGYIDREERAPEGPFMNLTDTYDTVREEPVIKLTRMYMRKDPIYHAIIPSGREHRLLMELPSLLPDSDK